MQILLGRKLTSLYLREDKKTVINFPYTFTAKSDVIEVTIRQDCPVFPHFLSNAEHSFTTDNEGNTLCARKVLLVFVHSEICETDKSSWLRDIRFQSCVKPKDKCEGCREK
jgi:hypothetical protein